MQLCNFFLISNKILYWNKKIELIIDKVTSFKLAYRHLCELSHVSDAKIVEMLKKRARGLHCDLQIITHNEPHAPVRNVIPGVGSLSL